MSFSSKVCEYGNPFAIEHPNLLKLNTQEACDPSVEESIRNLEENGKKQYQSYVSEVLEKGSKSIHAPIPKNSYPLMSTPLKKIGTAPSDKMKIIKSNNTIISQFVAVAPHRDISLSKVFSYEMHSFPPSLSTTGDLYLPGKKSNILKEIASPCLDVSNVPTEYDSKSALIMDGGRIPYQYSPKKNASFKEYAEAIFYTLAVFCFL